MVNTNRGIGDVSSKLAELSQQVAYIENGAPAAVFATTAALDADATANTTEGKKRAYVVTADGKWYFWNGSAWTAGGTYQALAIADGSVYAKSIAARQLLLALQQQGSRQNMFDPYQTFASGYINDDGTLSGSTGYSTTDKIYLIPGAQYTIKTNWSNIAAHRGALFAADDSGLGYISDTTTSGVTFTAPLNASYMRLSFNNDSDKDYVNTQIVFGGAAPTLYDAYGIYIDLIKANNKWSRKKWNAIGDSFTATPSRYINQTLHKTGLGAVNNYGISGCTMANVNASSVVNRYEDFAADADITTILIGTNDYGNSIAIGTIDSTDDTEFYGAYKEVIEALLTANPAQRLILITPAFREMEITNDKGHKLFDYADAIIALGKRYSLPVVDLFYESGINTLTLSTYLEDGLHPNPVGANRIADMLSAMAIRL